MLGCHTPGDAKFDHLVEMGTARALHLKGTFSPL